MTENERLPRLRLLRWVPIVVVLGLVIHFLLPRVGAIEGSLRTLRHMAPLPVALAVLAEVASYGANGLLLQSVIACVARERISWARAIAIEIGAGSVAIVAGGALGFTAAIFKWTRDGGVTRETAMLSSWLPSLFDSATLIVFALASAIELLLFHKLSRVTITALAAVVAVLSTVIVLAFAFLARTDWMAAAAARTTRLIRRVRPSFDERLLADAAERAGTAWQVLRHGGWLRPAASSFAILAFDLLSLGCVFLAAGERIHPTVLIAGYGVPMLLGRASFLPGGIAVVEVAMAALYTALGVPGDVAVVAVLVYRFLSFWLPALTGIPVALALQAKRTAPADE